MKKLAFPIYFKFRKWNFHSNRLLRYFITIQFNPITIHNHGYLDKSIKQRLLTEMFVEATILNDSKKGLAIPFYALVTEDNKNYVLLLKSTLAEAYVFEKVAVTIGEKSTIEVELVENKRVNKESKIWIKGVFDIY